MCMIMVSAEIGKLREAMVLIWGENRAFWPIYIVTSVEFRHILNKQGK